MRGLSLAIQEGASAYLKRQYTVIGAVGVVLFIALIPLVEARHGKQLGPVKDALSRLQMFYAQRSGAQAPADEPAKPEPGGTGPAQSSGRLWVPGQ